MQIRIEGTDLPGRGPGAEASALRLRQVHVGVQRKAEVVSLFPADAVSVEWDLLVTSTERDGLLDVGGPWVHGRPGARFLYLSWGSVDGSRFDMFRRAKLLFGDIPGPLLRSGHDGTGVLVGRLGLTDPDGGPRCARVRPPDISWSLEPRPPNPRPLEPRPLEPRPPNPRSLGPRSLGPRSLGPRPLESRPLDRPGPEPLSSDPS